jgi:hypothetical protein
MKGGGFPKKRNEIQRSAKVREGRSEGAKRREHCLEVGNDAKRWGMSGEPTPNSEVRTPIGLRDHPQVTHMSSLLYHYGHCSYSI